MAHHWPADPSRPDRSYTCPCPGPERSPKSIRSWSKTWGYGRAIAETDSRIRRYGVVVGITARPYVVSCVQMLQLHGPPPTYNFDYCNLPAYSPFANAWWVLEHLSVCLCVCNALILESLDLEIQFSVCGSAGSESYGQIRT